jgi:Zn-dependent peptidase ImmA (M78 family)
MQNPKALCVSFAVINVLASTFGEKHGHKPGQDLSKIVSKLGGKVYSSSIMDTHEFPENMSMIVTNNVPLIKKDFCCGPRRDQFEIAHNLGHFVLHYEYRKTVLGEHTLQLQAPRYGTDNADREANFFARVLMMPDAAYKAEYDRLCGDHSRIAMHFNTLYSQSVVRACELRLEVPAAN